MVAKVWKCHVLVAKAWTCLILVWKVWTCQSFCRESMEMSLGPRPGKTAQKPLKSCLKNRSKITARNERFLSGFLSKIWAVWAQTAQTVKPLKSCWKTAQTAQILSGFWAGSRPGWAKLHVSKETQFAHILPLFIRTRCLYQPKLVPVFVELLLPLLLYRLRDLGSTSKFHMQVIWGVYRIRWRNEGVSFSFHCSFLPSFCDRSYYQVSFTNIFLGFAHFSHHGLVPLYTRD